jgi:DNA-binding XRE family transcriptional regulator
MRIEAMQVVTLSGKEYVILERQEYERIAAESGADLPPLPEPDAEGLTPAVDYGRALLARKIIRRREAVGVTQSALAKSARIRQETMNRIERGKVNPDDKTLRKIVRALERFEKATRREGN